MKLRKLPLTAFLFLCGGFIGPLEGDGDFSTSRATSGQAVYLLPWVPIPNHTKTQSSGKSQINPSQVEKYLEEALIAIYDGGLGVAIKKCEDALRIDPSNATAIGRMGSAFYLDGEQEKAVTLWKRALEMEPKNQTAKNLLNKLTGKNE